MFKRILLALLVIAVLYVGWEWITFPDTAKLAKENPTTTAFMDARRAELRAAGQDDTLLQTWVPYGRISPYLRRGVLVAEDDAFYEHNGVDVKGLEEALQKDWAHKKLTHGGSTITQQLAKNLYLSKSRNPLRKIREYFIARSLESHLTKKRILELYLNFAEMGDRVYGAEAAARTYFNTSAANLSPQQAALLAGCLPNPHVMSPASPNKRLRWRQRMVLSRMRRWGYLFEKEVLTEKKPEAPVTDTTGMTATTATVDTALQQAPPTDTATPATPPPETETGTPPPETDTSPPTSTESNPTTDTRGF